MTTRGKVLERLRAGSCSLAELALAAGVSKKTAQKTVERLVDDGVHIVNAGGSGRLGVYRLIEGRRVCAAPHCGTILRASSDDVFCALHRDKLNELELELLLKAV